MEELLDQRVEGYESTCPFHTTLLARLWAAVMPGADRLETLVSYAQAGGGVGFVCWAFEPRGGDGFHASSSRLDFARWVFLLDHRGNARTSVRMRRYKWKRVGFPTTDPSAMFVGPAHGGAGLLGLEVC